MSRISSFLPYCCSRECNFRFKAAFAERQTRIIGVQSFKGSLRRTCVLSSTLGEGNITLNQQFCGGYIDPNTLQPIGFIQANGENASATKGYICPLGQVCQVWLHAIYTIIR